MATNAGPAPISPFVATGADAPVRWPVPRVGWQCAAAMPTLLPAGFVAGPAMRCLRAAARVAFGWARPSQPLDPLAVLAGFAPANAAVQRHRFWTPGGWWGEQIDRGRWRLTVRGLYVLERGDTFVALFAAGQGPLRFEPTLRSIAGELAQQQTTGDGPEASEYGPDRDVQRVVSAQIHPGQTDAARQQQRR